MGTTGGGVFKTLDGGQSWAPMTDKYFGGTIGADRGVADQSRHRVRRRRRVSPSAATSRTARACGSPPTPARPGRRSASRLTRQISRVRVAPDQPRHRVRRGARATSGRRRRSAASTARRTAGRAGTRSSSATTPPARSTSRWIRSNPNVLYAAFWQAGRTPWMLVSGGEGSGIFKTTDGGDTGRRSARNPGMPAGIIGNIGIDVSPRAIRTASGRSSRRTPAACSASDDGGATWTRINSDRALRQRAWYYTKIHADTEGLEHRLRQQRQLPQVHGRREDVPAGARHPARRLARLLDRARRQPAHDRGRRWRRERVHRRRRAPGASRTSRPRSSITSSPPTHFPYHGLRRAAGQQHAVRPEPQGGRHRRRRLGGGGRRRVRLHRVALRQSRHRLRRQLRRAAHAQGPAHGPRRATSTRGPTTRWATRRST